MRKLSWRKIQKVINKYTKLQSIWDALTCTTQLLLYLLSQLQSMHWDIILVLLSFHVEKNLSTDILSWKVCSKGVKVPFLIDGIYPKASCKGGAHDSQRGDSTYLARTWDTCAAAFTSPLDQQVVLSVARITGVAGLPLKMWSSSKSINFYLPWLPGQELKPGPRVTKLMLYLWAIHIPWEWKWSFLCEPVNTNTNWTVTCFGMKMGYLNFAMFLQGGGVNFLTVQLMLPNSSCAVLLLSLSWKHMPDTHSKHTFHNSLSHWIASALCVASADAVCVVLLLLGRWQHWLNRQKKHLASCSSRCSWVYGTLGPRSSP